MTTHRGILIIAAFVLGCGTVQPSVGPGQDTLVDGFPSKPWPNQRRPGPDGRCGRRGPPHVIVVNGGCWVWVEADLAQCEEANKEGDYYVPHQGRCYYPKFKLPFREPTSSR